MDGYQARLILALPEFDTYGVLPTFARNPNRLDSRVAFDLLKRRALTHIQWDINVATAQTGIDFDVVKNLRLGMPVSGGKGAGIRAIMKMSGAEQLSYYEKCCKLAGMAIDSCTSLEQGKGAQSDIDGKE